MGVSKHQSDSRASVRTNWPQTKGAKKVGIFLFQRCFPHPCFLERRSVAETHTPSSLPGFYTVGRSDLVLSQTTGLGYNENNKRQVILAWLGIQVTWPLLLAPLCPNTCLTATGGLSIRAAQCSAGCGLGFGGLVKGYSLQAGLQSVGDRQNSESLRRRNFC